MADVKTKYPATNADTAALTITLASLANDTTQLVGQESDAVSNLVNLDLDHLLSGVIRLGGATPTVNKRIEVWVYAPIKVVSGVPTYPDTLDGGNSAETLTSAFVKASMLRLAWSTDTDAAIGRDYFIPPTSIAQLFGGVMPTHWGVWVTHNTGVALDSTPANHYLHYQRVQNTVA